MSEDDSEAWVSSLFTDDDIEAWVSSLFTDDHQNPISSIPQHSHSLSEDDIEAWVSSLFTDDDQNPISLVRFLNTPAEEIGKLRAKKGLSTCLYMSECPLYIYICVCLLLN